MKVFHCDHCRQPVFFENTQCVNCGHVLAYLPDVADIGSFEPPVGVSFISRSRNGNGRRYRLCRNYVEFQVCNWTVTEDEGEQHLCRACRLTGVIPDLGVEGHRDAWGRMEAAKRRLLYSLYPLGL